MEDQKVSSGLWAKIHNEIAPKIEGHDQYYMNRLYRKLIELDLIAPSKIVYSEESIERKVAESRERLIRLGVPGKRIGKMCALTFLALCNQKPADNWKHLKPLSLGMSNGIMKFVADYYNVEYKTGTRESFRKEGINLLLSYEIINLNPDNPNLGPNSPLTHYAVKQSIIDKMAGK